jgi:hypothetical protein
VYRRPPHHRHPSGGSRVRGERSIDIQKRPDLEEQEILSEQSFSRDMRAKKALMRDDKSADELRNLYQLKSQKLYSGDEIGYTMIQPLMLC